MTLKEWMKLKELSDEAFGQLIKRSRMQVLRYRHGEQIPARKTMEKICEVTDNQVTPASFYEQRT